VALSLVAASVSLFAQTYQYKVEASHLYAERNIYAFPGLYGPPEYHMQLINLAAVFSAMPLPVDALHATDASREVIQSSRIAVAAQFGPFFPAHAPLQFRTGLSADVVQIGMLMLGAAGGYGIYTKQKVDTYNGAVTLDPSEWFVGPRVSLSPAPTVRVTETAGVGMRVAKDSRWHFYAEHSTVYRWEHDLAWSPCPGIGYSQHILFTTHEVMDRSLGCYRAFVVGQRLQVPLSEVLVPGLSLLVTGIHPAARTGNDGYEHDVNTRYADVLYVEASPEIAYSPSARVALKLAGGYTCDTMHGEYRSFSVRSSLALRF
jgi:hypothetical protein